MRNYSGQLPNETSENYLKKFKASVNCPKSEWHMNKPLFKNIYKHLIKKKNQSVLYSPLFPAQWYGDSIRDWCCQELRALSTPSIWRESFLLRRSQNFSHCLKFLRLSPKQVKLKSRDSVLLPGLHCGMEFPLRP